LLPHHSARDAIFKVSSAAVARIFDLSGFELGARNLILLFSSFYQLHLTFPICISVKQLICLYQQPSRTRLRKDEYISTSAREQSQAC
jgi:hypothetical protein